MPRLHFCYFPLEPRARWRFHLDFRNASWRDFTDGGEVVGSMGANRDVIAAVGHLPIQQHARLHETGRGESAVARGDRRARF